MGFTLSNYLPPSVSGAHSLHWERDRKAIVDILSQVVDGKLVVVLQDETVKRLGHAYEYTRSRESGSNYIFGSPQMVTYALHANGNRKSSYWNLVLKTPAAYVRDLSAIAPLNLTGPRLAGVLQRPLNDRIRARYEVVSKATVLPVCETDLNAEHDRLYRLMIGVLGSTPNHPFNDANHASNWVNFNPDLASSAWSPITFKVVDKENGNSVSTVISL